MYFYIFSLINFSSLIFFENLGGFFAFIPANSLVFLFLFLFLCVWMFFLKGGFYYSKYYLYILISFGFLFAPAFLFDSISYTNFLYRVVYLLSGLFFLVALVDKLRNSYILCVNLVLAVLALHAIIAFFQLLDLNFLAFFKLFDYDGVPVGVFQQVNLLSSALSFSVVLALYVMSNSIFFRQRAFLKFLPFFVIFISSLVVFSSGSRVGFLGLVLGVFFIYLGRFSFFKESPRFFLLTFLVMVVGGWGGLSLSDGFDRAKNKTEKLVFEGGDVRPVVYKISYDVFLDSPFKGHGIGSFSRVFHEKAAESQSALDSLAIGESRYSHPHNEIIFWAVEGGVISLVGILIIVISILALIFRKGIWEGFVFFALIFPIALHSMVELPFYLSAYHWFLILFSFFLIFRFDVEYLRVNLSGFMSGFLKLFSIILVIFSSAFFSSSFLISKSISRVFYYDLIDVSEVYKYRHHPLFTDFSIQVAFSGLASNERQQGGFEYNYMYAGWIEDYIKKIPEIGLYVELIEIYFYLGESEMLNSTVERALYLYPNNRGLKNVVEKISKNEDVYD